MKNLLTVTFLVLLTFAFTMCSGSKSEAIPVGSSWKVESLLLNENNVAIPTDLPATITFTDSTNINGNTSCNLFFGNYKVGENDLLALSPMVMTRMAGPNLAFEGSFMEALSLVRSYMLKNNVLSLNDDNGKVIMTLVPYTAPIEPIQTPNDSTVIHVGDPSVLVE